jgi:hypothetical protein
MDWLRRKLKKKNTQEEDLDLASLISLSPIDDPVNIVVAPEEPLRPSRITPALLQQVWPRVIDAIADFNENTRQALKKRAHALSLIQNTVLLYINDESLFSVLQQESYYQYRIAQGLSETLGISLVFQFTDTITITFETDAEEPLAPFHVRPVKNAIDVVAQQFLCARSNRFSLLEPEEVIHILPLNARNVELHWFRVRHNAPTGHLRKEAYFDVFCISAAADVPLNREEERRREYSQTASQIASKLYSPLTTQYALASEMIEEIAQHILTRLAQEKHPVANDTFFLFVATFPQGGIHQLTRAFDLAPTRVTPIPFAVTIVKDFEAGLPASKLIQGRMDDWTRRANHYYRTTPVVGEDYYRQDNTADLIRECIRQGQPFGLFGLRRMGKTSLLLEMQRAQEFGSACVSLKNMQAYLHRPSWAVLRDALKDWIEALAPLLPPEQRQDLAQIDPQRALEPLRIDLFKQYLHSLLRLLPPEMRLVLILDEVGELLPIAPDFTEEQFPDWREFLAFLRAIVYESSGNGQGHFDQKPRFVLGVANYQDDIVYSSFGRDSNYNPWWKQFREITLRPLSRQDCDRMVQDIGAMAGLYYTPGALDTLYAQTYGHPQITRELCNALAEHTEHVPRTVEAQEVLATSDGFVEHNITMEKMHKSLQEIERRIIDYLATVEEARTSDLERAVASYCSDKGEFNHTLIKMDRFGLVKKDHNTVSLTFGLFRKYVTSQQ